jgi:hypothetical protein
MSEPSPRNDSRCPLRDSARWTLKGRHGPLTTSSVDESDRSFSVPFELTTTLRWRKWSLNPPSGNHVEGQ